MNTPHNTPGQHKDQATPSEMPRNGAGLRAVPLSGLLSTSGAAGVLFDAQMAVQRVTPAPVPAARPVEVRARVRPSRLLLFVVGSFVGVLMLLRAVISWPFVWFFSCYLIAAQVLIGALEHAGVSVGWVLVARLGLDLACLFLVTLREWFWELCWERSLLRRVIFQGC